MKAYLLKARTSGELRILSFDTCGWPKGGEFQDMIQLQKGEPIIFLCDESVSLADGSVWNASAILSSRGLVFVNKTSI